MANYIPAVDIHILGGLTTVPESKDIIPGNYWRAPKEEEKVVQQCITELPILEEVKNKRRTSNQTGPTQPDLFYDSNRIVGSPTHVLIEAIDNYQALWALLAAGFGGKVDIIEIDRPYNTGGDFTYNDKWIRADDPERHSKWLAMAYRRDKLARDLLSPTGIIIGHIDDHEYARLKLLWDEIFFEQNFLTTAIWQKKIRPSNKSERGFSSTTEYILFYAKDITKLPPFVGDERSEEYLNTFTNPDNDPRGPWRTQALWSESNNNQRKTLILPDGSKKTEKWFCSQEGLNKLYEEDSEYPGWNYIHISSNGMPRRKQHQKDNPDNKQNPINFLPASLVGTTEEATNELKKMFDGKKVFDYPKPVRLIQYIIGQIKKRDAIVLDYYAGSGTTGHAVLKLNREDPNSCKQFILITNNENNGNTLPNGICTDVCYPRLVKAMEGYTTPNGEKIPGLGGSLKYYRTAFIKHTKNTDQMLANIANKCTAPLCAAENIYNMTAEYCDDKSGTVCWRAFEQNDRIMAIYYTLREKKSFEELKKFMCGAGGLKKLYYFTTSRDGLTDEYFEGWPKDIEKCPIPHKMLDMYNLIFRDK